jgi:dihydrodipicolinate synthase/N-acetylneuraminate lyase
MYIKKRYRGVVAPMITPLDEKGSIDEGAVRRITRHLVENEVAPFPLGTTGEAASIPQELRPKLVESVVTAAAGKTLVYAGISDNCLQNSVEAAKRYHELGVDVLVAHLPSYYPLDPGAILKYYEKLVDQLPGPLILYNISITTHISIPIEIIDKLSHHPKIVGIKDSDDDTTRLMTGLRLWANRPDFSHMTGCGMLSAKALTMGCDGIVHGVANLVPDLIQELYLAAIQGDQQRLEEMQLRADELSTLIQKDRNLGQSLAVLKAMMNAFGFCGPQMLPPLLALNQQQQELILHKLLQLPWISERLNKNQ